MSSQSGSHPELAFEELDSPSTAYRPLPAQNSSPETFGSKTVINPERRGSDSSSPGPQKSAEQSSSIFHRLFSQESESGQIADPKGLELLHFRLECQIGSGGMGSVFKALDSQLNRVVALKVLSPRYSNDTAAIKRFRNESRSAAALEHENIAKVYFYGEDHGLHFIAFEFIEGVNVRELIQRKGSLAPLDALSYTLQVAAALNHTALKGVFHRDVKPSNIIVKENGRAILVDWGLARSVNNAVEQSADLTVAGTTLGTFDYISPEQARDPRNVDARSDIYSLGCTFYHMLTGEPPYGEGTVLQKLLDHQDKVVPDPSAKNPAVIPEMSDVVMRMMASDPRHRYQTVSELMQDLTLLAAHLGLQGVPAESVIWTRPQPIVSRRNFFEENLGWFTVIAILFISVFIVEYINRPSSTNGRQVGGNSFSTATGVQDGQNPGSQNRNNGSGSSETNVLSLTKVFPNEDPTSIQVGSSWMQDVLIDIDNPGSDSTTDTSVTGNNLADVVSSSDDSGSSGTSTKMITTSGDPENGENGNGQSQENLFRLINRRGIEVASFGSLSKAIATATDQATIKIYSPKSGEAIQISEPILIREKRITLRADSGFVPTLHFGSMATSGKNHAIRIEKGSLELVNLNLLIDVEKSFEHPSQVLVELLDAERLVIKNASLTVNNQDRIDYSILGVAHTSDYANMKKMMTRGDLSPLDVLVETTLIRGHSDFLVLQSADIAKFTVRQTALALDGVFLRNLGEESFRTDEERNIEVSLENVTAFLQQGFLLTDLGDQPNSSAIININSKRSIYSLGSGMPFAAMSGNVIPTDFIDFLFFWEGDQNFFENTSVMLTIDGALGEDPIPDFDNLTTWGEWSNTQPSGEKIVWTNSNRPIDYATYTIQNFQLDANAETNPASALEVGVNPDVLPGFVEPTEKSSSSTTTGKPELNIIDATTPSS